MKPPPEERKQNFKTKKLNEPIRGGQEAPHPLTLTHQSVANKTSLVKELTNPLKLPVFPTIRYKNRSPPSLGALSAWPLGCVEGVPAPACNKVPHCFCINPRLLWCLVGFRHPGTTQLSDLVCILNLPTRGTEWDGYSLTPGAKWLPKLRQTRPH